MLTDSPQPRVRKRKRYGRPRPELQGPRWQAVRRATLLRDRYRCRVCLRAGRLEVDHIVPVYRGGAAYDPANLQTLCRDCHIEKTRRENRGMNRKPLPPAWAELVNELRA